jgi:hypothetical protein
MTPRAQHSLTTLAKHNLKEAIALLYQWAKTNYLTKGEFEDVMMEFFIKR